MSVIRKIEHVKRDYRFANVHRQAAKSLGVKIENNVTNVFSAYDKSRWYVQVFTTQCGNYLVVYADDASLSTSLCSRSLDWNESLCDERQTYLSIAENSGLSRLR